MDTYLLIKSIHILTGTIWLSGYFVLISILYYQDESSNINDFSRLIYILEKRASILLGTLGLIGIFLGFFLLEKNDYLSFPFGIDPRIRNKFILSFVLLILMIIIGKLSGKLKPGGSLNHMHTKTHFAKRSLSILIFLYFILYFIFIHTMVTFRTN